MLSKLRNTVKSLGASTVGPPPRSAAPRASRPGDRPFCRLDQLEWSLLKGVPIAPRLFAATGGTDGADVPLSLYAALRAGGIIEEPASDLGSVFDAVAEGHTSAYRHGRVELLARLRSLGPGGFLITRDGVAVSHPRRPLILPVAEPVLTLRRFESVSDESDGGMAGVRLVLVLACPTIRLQLAALAALSRLLAAGRFLTLVGDGATTDELMDHVWLHDCGLDRDEWSIPRQFAE